MFLSFSWVDLTRIPKWLHGYRENRQYYFVKTNGFNIVFNKYKSFEKINLKKSIYRKNWKYVH